MATVLPSLGIPARNKARRPRPARVQLVMVVWGHHSGNGEWPGPSFQRGMSYLARQIRQFIVWLVMGVADGVTGLSHSRSKTRPSDRSGSGPTLNHWRGSKSCRRR